MLNLFAIRFSFSLFLSHSQNKIEAYIFWIIKHFHLQLFCSLDGKKFLLFFVFHLDHFDNADKIYMFIKSAAENLAFAFRLIWTFLWSQCGKIKCCFCGFNMTSIWVQFSFTLNQNFKFLYWKLFVCSSFNRIRSCNECTHSVSGQIFYLHILCLSLDLKRTTCLLDYRKSVLMCNFFKEKFIVDWSTEAVY